MGEHPRDRVERFAVVEAMTDHAATARSGDNTLSAGIKAVEEMLDLCGWWKDVERRQELEGQCSISASFDVERVSFIIPYYHVLSCFAELQVHMGAGQCVCSVILCSSHGGEKSIEMVALYDSYNHGVDGIQIGSSMMLDIYIEGPAAQKLNLQMPKGVGWRDVQSQVGLAARWSSCSSLWPRIVKHEADDYFVFLISDANLRGFFGVEEGISRQMFAQPFFEIDLYN